MTGPSPSMIHDTHTLIFSSIGNGNTYHGAER